MTSVFRIETKDGRGICFRSQHKLCDAYWQRCHDEKSQVCWSPEQQEEAAVRTIIKKQSYGFPSLEALKDWFPQAIGRKAMAALGAELHEFETEDFITDGHQIIFDKAKATKIAMWNLETLEKLP